jgi:hypothetical protein
MSFVAKALYPNSIAAYELCSLRALKPYSCILKALQPKSHIALEHWILRALWPKSIVA